MKKTIFFLVLYVVASCAPTTSVMAETGNNIEQAYYEKWVAGMRNGGKGINFYLDLKAPFSKHAQLKKLIFRGYEVDFIQVDELHYEATIITADNSETEESGNITIKPSPQVKSKLSDNQALFLFDYDGKPAQQEYNKVLEKGMLLYPVAR